MAGKKKKDDAIRIEDLYFHLGSKRIFRGLDIAFEKGKITAVMGPSGTGKTTLLRLITGQLVPDRGRIVVDGVNISELSRKRLYEFRKRFGMLFQNGALLTDLDVFENVAFPLREHTRLPERLVRHVVLTKLHAVGLRGAADMRPAALSGGMARRVALARAMVMDPDILIYDEPFVGLDPISLGVVLRLIKRLNEGLGITSIIVSHDVAETSSIADRSYLISGGRVVASGTPKELEQHGGAVVRQFLSGMADGPVPFHYPGPDYASQLLSRDD